MREIKFRAYSSERKEFMYSDNMNGVDRDCNGGWWGDCILDDIEQYPKIDQYTGLKDSKGIEIYEGDILKFDSGVIHDVIWNDVGYYQLSKPGDMLDYGASTVCEVIGNIYENKELLQ